MKNWLLTAIIAICVVFNLVTWVAYHGAASDLIKIEREISNLSIEREAYREAAEKSNRAVDFLQSENKRIRQIYDEIQAQFDEIVRTSMKNSDVLASHNIADLAKIKPELVEQIINSGTKMTIECVESISNKGEVPC